MRPEEIDVLAERFLAAIAAGDTDTVRGIYADDATIWHNFDDKDQSPTENLRTLGYLHSVLADMRYEDVRRIVLPDGYLQQHVLRATGPRAALEIHAALRVYITDGRISRLEEYLDPAPFAAAMG